MSTAPSPTAAGLGAAARSVLSRAQFWIVLLLVGACAAALTLLMSEESPAPHSLDSTDLNGYGALAQVLEDEGFSIHEASTGSQARQLMDEHSDAGVVVAQPPQSIHGPEEQLAQELIGAAADGEREALWLIGDAWAAEQLPGELPRDAMELETGPAGTAPEVPAGPHCETEAAQQAETIEAPGMGIISDHGCFPLDPEGYLLADTEHGLVLGAPDAFTNQHITSGGNAALGLSLAGDLSSEDGDLIWYTPSAEDAAGAQGDWMTPTELLDDWMLPLMLWLLIVGLLGAAAAGRRHGPVVVEPLPAEVPAGELTEGRARLYQRADARAEAAEALRAGALRRIGRTLRLGARPAVEDVVTAAARRTGRDRNELDALLRRPQAGSSPELVAYAQALHELEQQAAAVDTQRKENS